MQRLRRQAAKRPIHDETTTDDELTAAAPSKNPKSRRKQLQHSARMLAKLPDGTPIQPGDAIRSSAPRNPDETRRESGKPSRRADGKRALRPRRSLSSSEMDILQRNRKRAQLNGARRKKYVLRNKVPKRNYWRKSGAVIRGDINQPQVGDKTNTFYNQGHKH